MISITQLQRDQFIWARKNFGPCQTRWPLLGIVEETGELVHSQLKQEQNIRGSYEEHEAKKKDAIGDLTIYLFEYCSCMEWTVVDLLVEEETTLHALQEHTEDSEPVWDCLGKIVPLVHDKNNNGDNVLAQEDVVQILLNLAIFCRQRAWSLQELVETTWLRVSQRGLDEEQDRRRRHRRRRRQKARRVPRVPQVRQRQGGTAPPDLG
jgi:NTP pyrophosphatase (non-canonical NTP hydrolase)